MADCEQEPGPVFYRIDVAAVTRLTAPRYGTITFTERNSMHVLTGDGDLLLIGPMGINYHIEGSDQDVIYLRRWDQPRVTGHGSVTTFETPGGEHSVRTYKGARRHPSAPYPERHRPGRGPRP